MGNVNDGIKKVMSIVFEIPINQITYNASPDTIGTWDSVRHLNLILALEEEFDISIPDDEVGNMLNFKLIELVINDCKK